MCWRTVLLRALLLPMLALVVSGGAYAVSTTESAGHLLSFQEWVAAGGSKVLLVRDPAVGRAEVTVRVRFGSFHEPRELGGLAHLREHLVAYASASGDEALVPWLRRQHQGDYWFKTRDSDTVYFAAAESAKSRELLERIRKALLPRPYSTADVLLQIEDLEREWRQFQGQDAQLLEQMESFAARPTHPVAHFRSGNAASLAVSRAEDLATQARAMTDAQHEDCALSWVFVSSLPLEEMQRIFEDALGQPLGSGGRHARCRDGGQQTANPVPLWRSDVAGRLTAIDGFENDEELWLVLASPGHRTRDVGEFWVAQMEGGHATSLRQQLRARGWIRNLSADFEPRYFGSMDRWCLRLHLTEAGKARLSALRQSIESWWRKGTRSSGAALRRYEAIASESRRWSPAASRAQWGFHTATALSLCSGHAVFQHCESSASRPAVEGRLPPWRQKDLMAWIVPHDRVRRLAWLARWHEREPGQRNWPATQLDRPVSPVAEARPQAESLAALFDGRLAQRPARIIAEWARRGWPVCQRPGDINEPFIASVKAEVDLSPLDAVDRVRVLVALAWGRSSDGVLGSIHHGFGQAMEWRLNGTTVELLVRGRRDWQLGAMHAWLQVLSGAGAQGEDAGALQEVRTRASGEARDPVFDTLVSQMMRDAGQDPLQLSAWLGAFDRSNGSAVEERSAGRRWHLPVRVWVSEGASTGARTGACRAPQLHGDREVWRDVGSYSRQVALPSGANASALLLRCEPWDAMRFWLARQSRSALRYQLRTLAREQGLDIAFISAVAFAVPGGTCWGAFAEATATPDRPLAASLMQLLNRRASMFAGDSADAVRHPDWQLSRAACDADGWSQVWSAGWPDALANCPFDEGVTGRAASSREEMEGWLQREWSSTQAWRVYVGLPEINGD